MTDDPAQPFEDIVAAATIGLDHRPFTLHHTGTHADVIDRDDPAAGVLDAAALHVAARRAGRIHGTADLPVPAPPDTAPEFGAAAAEVVRRALVDPTLLGDLLTTAAARGFRAPAPLLPALLDAGQRNGDVRPAVGAVLGERGRWLATLRTDWQRVPVTLEQEDAEQWATGGRGPRRAHLLAVRQRDPGEARDLLAAGWARETAEDRAELIDVLAHRLTAADEPFLEAGLDDRSVPVRRRAARLLGRLPDSAHVARAVARSADLLHVDRRRLMARLPTDADPAAVRDGISPTPPVPSIGAGAWLLTEVIALVPLDVWTRRLGRDAPTLPSEFRLDIHAGWRMAAVRQRDAGWAAALLDAGVTASRPAAAWPNDDLLIAVLTPPDRLARAITLLKAGEPSSVVGVPRPWPPELADAVLALLGRYQLLADNRAILPMVGYGVPVDGPRDYATELRERADAAPQDTAWPSALRRAAQTVDLRRRFHEELR